MFRDEHMDTVKNTIIIDQFYCWCSNQTSAVHVSDISYSNIKGTCDTRSPHIHFRCSDSVPCSNPTLSEIELLPALGDIVLNPFCRNVYGDAQTLPHTHCSLIRGFAQVHHEERCTHLLVLVFITLFLIRYKRYI